MSDNNKRIRTRIAPSPTGNFHVGTARTALFNYLFAKHNSGDFIVRIEDTDRIRSKKEFEEGILAGFKWLGINWDEGPDTIGKYGPYRQTERLDTYKKYLEQLYSEGKIYKCFCSKEELEKEKQEQAAKGKAPHYSGVCSNLSKEQIEQNEKEGKNYVLRIKNANKNITFHDLIRGDITFDTTLLGDFVIAKNFDEPLYNFAVVVDDYLMQITHVIRGEEHISNTPRQILLQQALGFSEVEYAHLPLLLGPDRSKLSKRHGATPVDEYRKQGYLPEAFLNFIILLGWNPGNDQEIMSLEDMVRQFSFDHVQKAGAIFNVEKLDWLNGVYIRNLSDEALLEKCLPYLPEEATIKYSSEKLMAIIKLEKERIKKLSDVTSSTGFFFMTPVYEKESLVWKTQTLQDVAAALAAAKEAISGIADWNVDIIKDTLMKLSESYENRGQILWPLRVALSGKKFSPPPFDIAAILGKEETIKRINSAIDLVKK